MSWEDMMRRILQPIERVSPHVTSGYGETTNRPRGSSNPHRGIDFNYVGGQEAPLNKSHPALRSPVDGVIENPGEDKWGTIAIRDKNGLLHQILHTNARHVNIGDPVAAGQLIGTMGNTGLIRKDGKKGDLHVHYQIKDAAEISAPILRFHRPRRSASKGFSEFGRHSQETIPLPI